MAASGRTSSVTSVTKTSMVPSGKVTLTTRSVTSVPGSTGIPRAFELAGLGGRHPQCDRGVGRGFAHYLGIKAAGDTHEKVQVVMEQETDERQRWISPIKQNQGRNRCADLA